MPGTADAPDTTGLDALAEDLAREAGIPPEAALRILRAFGVETHLAEAEALLRRPPRLDDLRLVLRIR